MKKDYLKGYIPARVLRLSAIGMMLLAALTTQATPGIEITEDNTLVITVNTAGDLAASNFTQAQMNATKIKVVTANGYKLSTSDVNDLLGSGWNTPPFSKILDLDLSLTDLANNNDISQLHNSNKLNNGNPLGTLVLPESLTAFPSGALDTNTCTWTQIVFPDATKTANEGTTVIAGGAFTKCKSIQSLVIGTSVKSIGGNAFDDCSNITAIDLHYGITRIDANAFYGCTGLTKIILPESLTEIGSNAFEECANLSSLRLPNSLEYIRASAFAGCTSLTTIVIPESVKLIERGTFQNNSLTDIYVLGSQTKCESQAFMPTNVAYGYSYSGPGNGETVSLEEFTSILGRYTTLHYPQEAYDNYVNPYIKVVGTPDYGPPYDSWNNKWVVDGDGNKLPVKPDKYFDNFSSLGLQSDYEGWWNFMLTGKLKGTFKDERLLDGKWYSVCFPFDLTAVQISDAFGSATEICEFSGAHILKDEEGKEYLRLEFKQPVTEMKAHHPYMIHPGIHNAEYNILVDVSVDTDTDGDDFQKKLQAESVTQTDEKGNEYTFIGNHTEGATVPMYSYYYYSGNDDSWPNAFYKAMRTGVVFTPHTAVVRQKRDNGISGAKAATAFFADSEGISGIAIAYGKAQTPQSAKVFDIYGRAVAGNGAGLQGLPAGIYIVNGKKIVKK